MICFILAYTLLLTSAPAEAGSNDDLQPQPQWKFRIDRCNLAGSLAHLDRKLKIVLERQQKWAEFLVLIEFPDRAASIKLRLHAFSQVIVHDGILYYPEYYFLSSGCTIHAIDQSSGKELWATKLDGSKLTTGYSKYSNYVNIECVSGQIYVYGQEQHANYIEILDANSGKQKAHFIVK